MRVPVGFMAATFAVMLLAGITVLADPAVEVAEPELLASLEELDVEAFNTTLEKRIAEEEVPQGKRPISEKEWDKQVKLMLATSCVGEAGWQAVDECIAIAWVYKKLADECGGSLTGVIRRYSSALKFRSTQTRPWLKDLKLEGKKPKSWPNNLSWTVHKMYWDSILSRLDRWAEGKEPDPLPEAIEYGGPMDTKHPTAGKWQKVEAPKYFGNIFWARPIRKS